MMAHASNGHYAQARAEEKRLISLTRHLKLNRALRVHRHIIKLQISRTFIDRLQIFLRIGNEN